MADPIADFFANYPEFSYRPSRDWTHYQVFQALHYHLRWSQADRALALGKLHQAWATVAKQEFPGDTYEHYRTILEQLGFDEIPNSVEGCQAELRQVNVNIVDLIQYRKDKRAGLNPPRPQLFTTVHELRDYSRKNGKSFPVVGAKAAVLGILLREDQT